MDEATFDEAARTTELHFAASTREANSALWGALLSFNGVLVSVLLGVVLIQSEGSVLIAVLILLSMFSSVLLIGNYRDVKKVYKRIGHSISTSASKSDEELKGELEWAAHKHRVIEAREVRVIRVLYVQAVSLIALLVSQLGPLPWTFA